MDIEAFIEDGAPIASAEDQDIIDNCERRFIHASLNGDTKVLDGLLAESFTYIRENGKILTRPEYYEGFVDVGFDDARHDKWYKTLRYGNTILTIGTGCLRRHDEAEYPRTAVSHIWVKSNHNWKMVHRQESHQGNCIGPLLPQSGGPNLLAALGDKPTPEAYETISANEAAWSVAHVTNDVEAMTALLHPNLRYVHAVDLVSPKSKFMDAMRIGISEAELQQSHLRQYGTTVLALHNAQFRHRGGPKQSRSQVMHCWEKFEDGWKIVQRHSTRFLPY